MGYVKIFPDQSTPPPTTAKFSDAQIVDVNKIAAITPKATQESLLIASQKMELEGNVTFCKNAGIEWLEVSEELLKSFCQGKLPQAGYFIYKDVKLCLKGTAEQIAQRDALNCHQVLFPDEGYMKVR